jgi:hypothetical protein
VKNIAELFTPGTRVYLSPDPFSDTGYVQGFTWQYTYLDQDPSGLLLRWDATESHWVDYARNERGDPTNPITDHVWSEPEPHTETVFVPWSAVRRISDQPISYLRS